MTALDDFCRLNREFQAKAELCRALALRKEEQDCSPIEQVLKHRTFTTEQLVTLAECSTLTLRTDLEKAQGLAGDAQQESVRISLCAAFQDIPNKAGTVLRRAADVLRNPKETTPLEVKMNEERMIVMAAAMSTALKTIVHNYRLILPENVDCASTLEVLDSYEKYFAPSFLAASVAMAEEFKIGDMDTVVRDFAKTADDAACEQLINGEPEDRWLCSTLPRTPSTPEGLINDGKDHLYICLPAGFNAQPSV